MDPAAMQAGSAPQVPKLGRTVLLLCGVVAAVVYVGGDILAAMLWEDYSYAHQTISELMAIGAPTRPVLVVLFSFFDALTIAFGVGVWASARGKRTLRIVGILLIVWAVVGWVGLISMPMHQRGAGVSATDVLHIADAAAIVLLILLSIGFGAAALGKGFRIYSIATIVILLVFGALTAQQGPRIAANLPTPWIGIEERVNVYVSMLWIVVLAIALLRAQQGTGANRPKVTKG